MRNNLRCCVFAGPCRGQIRSHHLHPRCSAWFRVCRLVRPLQTLRLRRSIPSSNLHRFCSTCLKSVSNWQGGFKGGVLFVGRLMGVCPQQRKATWWSLCARAFNPLFIEGALRLQRCPKTRTRPSRLASASVRPGCVQSGRLGPTSAAGRVSCLGIESIMSFRFPSWRNTTQTLQMRMQRGEEASSGALGSLSMSDVDNRPNEAPSALQSLEIFNRRVQGATQQQQLLQTHRKSLTNSIKGQKKKKPLATKQTPRESAKVCVLLFIKTQGMSIRAVCTAGGLSGPPAHTMTFYCSAR